MTNAKRMYDVSGGIKQIDAETEQVKQEEQCVFNGCEHRAVSPAQTET